MKTTLLAASALALAGGTAFAGGLTEPVMTAAPAPVAVAPAPAPVMMAGNDWSGFYVGGQVGYGQLDATGFADDTEDMTYGVHAGYLYDLGSVVVGGEVDYDMTDIVDDNTGIELDSVTRAKARVGYDAGSFLPYVTAGAAMAETSGGYDGSDTGYFYGIGADYAVTDSIRVGAEALRHEFEDFDGTGTDIEATTASLRVSYSF